MLHLQRYGDLRLIETNGDPVRSPIKGLLTMAHIYARAVNSAIMGWLSFCGATSKLRAVYSMAKIGIVGIAGGAEAVVAAWSASLRLAAATSTAEASF